jgi:hypothetical protein
MWTVLCKLHFSYCDNKLGLVHSDVVCYECVKEWRYFPFFCCCDARGVWCDFFGLVGLVYWAWKNVLCKWSKSRKRCYVNTTGETKTSGAQISLWVAVLSNLSHQKTKQMGDSVCCYPPLQTDMLIFFHSLCNWIQRQPWRHQLLLQLHRIWWIHCPASTLNSAWESTKL